MLEGPRARGEGQRPLTVAPPECAFEALADPRKAANAKPGWRGDGLLPHAEEPEDLLEG